MKDMPIDAPFVDAARAAEMAMRSIFPPTPVQRNAFLSDRYEADIWLKREDLSPVRSYKLRGAFNAMRKRTEASLFVCASAGNHAQGMAFMCAQLGKRGVIFMPVTTPQQKIDKTRVFGAGQIEIHLVGDYFDETLAAAQDWYVKHDGVFLSPFDDSDVIEGQASIAAELEAQMPHLPDVIVLPVGGGGMSSGVWRYLRGRTTPILVEPAGGACLSVALENGGPLALDQVDTFVDGAAVGQIGGRPFAQLCDVPRENVFKVPEDRLCVTILEMLNSEGVVLEPAGALAVDVLRDLGESVRGKTVVCLTSGGNFDFERLPEVKERAQRWKGLKKYFIFRMPQRPGALKDFLGMLGPEDDISRFEYLKKSARNFGSVLIGIETTDAQNFGAFLAKLDKAGISYTDITNDELLSSFVV